MTMTNTQDEEGLLISELMTARYNTACAIQQWNLALSAKEKIEQAVRDYCKGNGLTEFETDMHRVSIDDNNKITIESK